MRLIIKHSILNNNAIVINNAVANKTVADVL